MEEFIVLGLVPGTPIQISFWVWTTIVGLVLYVALLRKLRRQPMLPKRLVLFERRIAKVLYGVLPVNQTQIKKFFSNSQDLRVLAVALSFVIIMHTKMLTFMLLRRRA